MAESDRSSVALYAQLYEMTAHLLDLARNENWAELRLELPKQRQQVAKLESMRQSVSQLTPAQRAEIEVWLQRTEQANEELVRRSALWKNELSAMLEDIGTARTNVRRLVRAYG